MFISDFGSHYSSETVLGARVLFNRKYTQKDKLRMNRDDLVRCTKSRFKVSLGGAGSTQKSDEKCSKTLQENIVTKNVKTSKEEIISFGSTPSKDIESWANNLDFVVPLKQRLRPIWKLFEPNALTKIDPYHE